MHKAKEEAIEVEGRVTDELTLRAGGGITRQLVSACCYRIVPAIGQS